MKNWHIGLKVLTVMLSFFLVFPCSIVSSAASKAPTQVKHKPPGYYFPGFRIILDAQVKEDVGVLVVRCYFKTKREKNFVFVDMLPKDNPGYQATLPAPWINSEYIEYVFVVVNNDKKVTRTQVFTMEEKETKQAAAWKEAGEVKEIRLDEIQEVLENYDDIKQSLRAEYKKKLPKWQLAEDSRKLGVFTEFEGASGGGGQLKGFYDTITVTTVSSSSKYGVMAEGLYTDSEIAALGGETAAASTTGAATAGTVTATGTMGLSTIALGALVVGGATAVAVGGGSSSSSGPTTGGGSGGSLSDVTVSQTNITITVWDDALVDGDQIDLTVNGINYFSNHVLTGPPGTTRNVLLNSGNNNLTVRADNEGGSPPNTAAIQISNVISGNPDQYWSLSTGEITTMTISAP
jgi:hypothetical protein